MKTFNQDQTLFMSLRFKDQNGSAVTPTSLEYVICDVTSDEEVARASVTPSDSTIIIQLPAEATEIVDSENDFEIKVLNWYYTYATLVEGVAGTGNGSGEFYYRVKNLFADKS